MGTIGLGPPNHILRKNRKTMFLKTLATTRDKNVDNTEVQNEAVDR